MSQVLPIDSVLADIVDALQQTRQCVLHAPPGAGKTTRVPLFLMQHLSLQGGLIVMLEPRRLAARGAAQFMAERLGERVGQRVGYQIRGEVKRSAVTQILVVTEGVFARMLLDDPELSEVAVVIFDEYHERHLDADVGLALSAQVQALLREDDKPLYLLVMSATLAGLEFGEVLPAAIEVACEGRAYPLQINYLADSPGRDAMVPTTVAVVQRALREQSGSVLVFLPGQAEIRQCSAALLEVISDSLVDINPLFGDLSLAEQRRAIEPSPEGRRKVVLATSIAESSLTIEGIQTVIDAGWSRTPRYDARTGMTRLHTQRCSRASADQRAGRAGRLGPGVCYRLWSEGQQQALVMQSPAEIEQVDLSGLALSLIAWGEPDPAELAWMTEPPTSAYQQALGLLESIGLIASNGRVWRLTANGELAVTLPVHPRYAAALVRAANWGVGNSACQLIALLEERNPFDNRRVDLMPRWHWINQPATSNKNLWQRCHQRARQLLGILDTLPINQADTLDNDLSKQQILALVLAHAYPDRIAQNREGRRTDYLLSNGRGVRLSEDDSLAGEPWLVVAEVGGAAGRRDDYVFSALALDGYLIDDYLLALTYEGEVVEWDDKTDSLLAEWRRNLGAIVLERKTCKSVHPDLLVEAMIAQIRRRGLHALTWSHHALQLRARLRIAARVIENQTWPACDDESLLQDLEQWLGPYLSGVSRLNQLAKVDVLQALRARLEWSQLQDLDRLLPEKIVVPTGTQVAIDYCAEIPKFAVRLQEVLGMAKSPVLADGRLPLQIHLLSPAQRPIAVTSDLASFWQNAYGEVKKDMKGRYPKHYWPDDPLQALPTRHVKARM